MTGVASIEPLSFPTPFRMAFKHSSAARSTTENVIVRAVMGDGTIGYGEGCPRSYVTGETTEGAARFYDDHLDGLAAAVGSVDDLRRWIEQNSQLIDDNPAAFCAVELALLDGLSRSQRVSIDQLLDLAPLSGPFTYSAVLGDNPPLLFAAQLARYRWSRLTDFKIKLSGRLGRDRRKVELLRRTGSLRLRVDANNHWSRPGPCIDFLRALETPLFGIEEPLQADDHQGFLEIAEALDAPIILDESLLRAEQLSALPGPAERWTLNCRVSKMGGLIRSLQAARRAAEHGSGLIVGAHVGETSLLTRAALTLVNANRESVQAQEGAFGTYLLTEDITAQPLMFARRGRLSLDAIDEVGLGVAVEASRLRPLNNTI